MSKIPQIIVVDNRPTGHVSSHVTIKERRAPTDASVALLKEMEAAASAKIVDAVHVANTAFDCVVHVAKDYANDCTRMRAVFSLNGQRETAEIEFRPRNPSDELQAANTLRDDVAKVIASKMIASAFAAMYRSK